MIQRHGGQLPDLMPHRRSSLRDYPGLFWLPASGFLAFEYLDYRAGYYLKATSLRVRQIHGGIGTFANAV